MITSDHGHFEFLSGSHAAGGAQQCPEMTPVKLVPKFHDDPSPIENRL
jgi:hypothetical protein